MTAPGASDPREQGAFSHAGPDVGHDPRPAVTLPGTGLPTPLLIGLAVVLALALFLFLDARRHARLDASDDQARALAQLPPSPPPLAIPPPPPPPAPMVVYQTRNVVVPAPIRAMPPPPMREPMPLPMPVSSEPLPQPHTAASGGSGLILDLTSGSGASISGSDGAPGVVEPDDTVRATLIRNRASIIPQGAIITAVLETPLNSDRPGLARAIVSHDARGFDGTRVLIPRGSRLFGEFKADTSPGMSRILISWSRLIRPDGVAIRIASPVSDTMGGSGVGGSVNTHWLARFSSAVLQSALAVGVNLASQTSSSANTVYLGLPSQSAGLGQQLVPNVNRAPTVKVREGAEVAVMVAHDLDFSGTPAVR
ncbi:MAG: TrbI/VirB10 family protein [Pseudomonadota bacterium]|nr:TrbI/VirB10 family protein [Pseudomonadota bacterium]